MPRVLRIIICVLALYPAWLAMMALHETGHVLHAWFSGVKVASVDLPLLGFSQTHLGRNPHPGFVAWGGAIWGSAIPLALHALLHVRRTHVPRAVAIAAQFFAGFCLIANGAYLGVGWLTRAGDAGDLVDLGNPPWVLVAFGFTTVTAGLYLWHRLGLPPTHAPKHDGGAGR